MSLEGLHAPVSSPLPHSKANPQTAPPQKWVNFLGVDFLHAHSRNGGDLFLTRYGAPLADWLQPENWHAREWFLTNRKPLVGTSTICHIATRPVHGRKLELIARYNRVGEDLLMERHRLSHNLHAEYNSPFEEVALVMDLRRGRFGPPHLRIFTKRPLAIYSPPERIELWESGRREHIIQSKHFRHPTINLDLYRQYMLLYGWIKGCDAEQAADHLKFKNSQRREFLLDVLGFVNHDLEMKGFRVLDMKPAHVILRLNPDGSLLRRRTGRLAYALIDYELLERTPDYERWLKTHHFAVPPQPVRTPPVAPAQTSLLPVRVKKAQPIHLLP